MSDLPFAQSTEVSNAIAAGMPACPSCHGQNTRTSLRVSFLDSVLAKLHFVPFRCRTCQHRFFKKLRKAA